MNHDFFTAELPPKGSRRAWKFTGPDREVTFDVLAVNGARPGPVLLVTGGVHGDEPEGPVAIQELFDQIEPEALTGCWVM